MTAPTLVRRKIVALRFDGDTVAVTWAASEPYRCDDDDCTLPHVLRDFFFMETLTPDADFYRDLADVFSRLADLTP